MTDPIERAKQLIALATRTPFSEEGRTAALAAVKLIEEHRMLQAAGSPGNATSQGLAAPPVDETQSLEIDRLKKEVARLRRKTRTAEPVVTSAMVLDAASKLQEIEALRREVVRLRSLPVAIALHVVQPGETPMSIATLYTGDPARLAELVSANPHKPAHLVGPWHTFASLTPGERLRLPSTWTG